MKHYPQILTRNKKDTVADRPKINASGIMLFSQNYVNIPPTLEFLTENLKLVA